MYYMELLILLYNDFLIIIKELTSILHTHIKHISLNLEQHCYLLYEESVREIISYLKSNIQ